MLLQVRYPELPRVGLRISAFALKLGFRPQGFGFRVLAALGLRLQLGFFGFRLRVLALGFREKPGLTQLCQLPGL